MPDVIGPAMPPADSWSPDILAGAINSVQSYVSGIRNQHAANNAELITMNQEVEDVDDPDVKAHLKGEIQRLVAGQRSLASRYNDMMSQFSNALNQARQFFTVIGQSLPGGLGQDPILAPSTLALLVIGVIGVAAAIYFGTRNQHDQIATLHDAVRYAVNQHATVDQVQQMLKSGPPKPPGSDVGEILKDLVPVLLVVGGLLIVPRLLDMFPKSRARAGA